MNMKNRKKDLFLLTTIKKGIKDKFKKKRERERESSEMIYLHKVIPIRCNANRALTAFYN